MLDLLKIILQYVAIFTFAGLAIIGYIQRDFNMGFGLNVALTVFYILLYLQPLKGLN